MKKDKKTIDLPSLFESPSALYTDDNVWEASEKEMNAFGGNNLAAWSLLDGCTHKHPELEQDNDKVCQQQKTYPNVSFGASLLTHLVSVVLSPLSSYSSK